MRSKTAQFSVVDPVFHYPVEGEDCVAAVSVPLKYSRLPRWFWGAYRSASGSRTLWKITVCANGNQASNPAPLLASFHGAFPRTELTTTELSPVISLSHRIARKECEALLYINDFLAEQFNDSLHLVSSVF
eukprot:gb/GECG01013634.1/.p1 GENE.gb/GECG01013634.1/~~gb/GECG01013634.1/.p1  ORF type:complete len:131 (+),score=5.34 gb/GECG01013634.1/:1-393(+)